jgi:hypothetical protein
LGGKRAKNGHFFSLKVGEKQAKFEFFKEKRALSRPLFYTANLNAAKYFVPG